MMRVPRRLLAVAGAAICVMGLVLPVSPAFAQTQYFCLSTSGLVYVQINGGNQTCPSPANVTISMYNGPTGGPYVLSATGNNGVVESFDSNIGTGTANTNCSPYPGSPSSCELNPDNTATSTQPNQNDNWGADIHSLGDNVYFTFTSGGHTVYWPDALTNQEVNAHCGQDSNVFADPAAPGGYVITNNNLHTCWSPAMNNPYPVCFGVDSFTYNNPSTPANKGGTITCTPFNHGVPEFPLGASVMVAVAFAAVLLMSRARGRTPSGRLGTG